MPSPVGVATVTKEGVMTIPSDAIGQAILDRLGVEPVIQAGGPNTKHSGSRPHPESLAAMRFASQHFFQMDELLLAAGKDIARMIGVPAATITAGAGAGLVVQAAAAVARDKQERIAQLPNTDGLPNELILQRGHRFGYERLYLVAGTKFIQVGTRDLCTPRDVKKAINSRTAGIIHLESPFLSDGMVPLPELAEIAHSHNLPVLCDAASDLPPRSNLTRFVNEGADLVSFSGGKTIRGLQSSGLLLGTEEWVEYARLNNFPNSGIARGQKVSREQIFGLIAALEVFLAGNEEHESIKYQEQMVHIVDRIANIPGIDARVEHDPPNHRIPSAVVYFTDDWRGPDRMEIQRRLLAGNPRVYVQILGLSGELYVDPMNLEEGQHKIVAERLNETLLEASMGSRTTNSS